MFVRTKATLSVCVVSFSLLNSAAITLAQTTTSGQVQSNNTSLPTAEEVIEKSVDALGGREKLKQVTGLVTSGTIEIPAAGLTGDLTMQQGSDGKFLMQMEIPGVMSQKSGSDGKTVWETSSITGTQILQGVRADQMKLQMTLFPILDLKQRFDSLECTGREVFAGEQCYVIVARKEGLPDMTTYYSAATGLEQGTRMTMATPAGDMNVVSEIKSYGSQDGIRFAAETEAKLSNGMSQVVKIAKMEVKNQIAADAFALPEDVRKLMQK